MGKKTKSTFSSPSQRCAAAAPSAGTALLKGSRDTKWDMKFKLHPAVFLLVFLLVFLVFPGGGEGRAALAPHKSSGYS